VRGWTIFRTALYEIPELGIYADGCYDAVQGKSVTGLLDQRAAIAYQELLAHDHEGKIKDGSVQFKRRFSELSRAGSRTINTDQILSSIRGDDLRAQARSNNNAAMLLMLNSMREEGEEDGSSPSSPSNSRPSSRGSGTESRPMSAVKVQTVDMIGGAGRFTDLHPDSNVPVSTCSDIIIRSDDTRRFTSADVIESSISDLIDADPLASAVSESAQQPLQTMPVNTATVTAKIKATEKARQAVAGARELAQNLKRAAEEDENRTLASAHSSQKDHSVSGTELEIKVTLGRNVTYQVGSQGFLLGKDREEQRARTTRTNKGDASSAGKGGKATGAGAGGGNSISTASSSSEYMKQEAELTKDIIARIEGREDAIVALKIAAVQAQRVYVENGAGSGKLVEDDEEPEVVAGGLAGSSADNERANQLYSLRFGHVKRKMNRAETKAHKHLRAAMTVVRLATIDTVEALGAWAKIYRIEKERQTKNPIPTVNNKKKTKGQQSDGGDRSRPPTGATTAAPLDLNALSRKASNITYGAPPSLDGSGSVAGSTITGVTSAAMGVNSIMDMIENKQAAGVSALEASGDPEDKGKRYAGIPFAANIRAKRSYSVIIATKGERLYLPSKPIVSEVRRFNRGIEEEKCSTVITHVGVFISKDDAIKAFTTACSKVPLEQRVSVYTDAPKMYIGLRNCHQHYLVRSDGISADLPCEECAKIQFRNGENVIPALPLSSKVAPELKITKFKPMTYLSTGGAPTSAPPGTGTGTGIGGAASAGRKKNTEFHPLPQFIWHDKDYLEKMWIDCNFLEENLFVTRFMSDEFVTTNNPLLLDFDDLERALVAIDVISSQMGAGKGKTRQDNANIINEANPLYHLKGRHQQLREAKKLGTISPPPVNKYGHLGLPFAEVQTVKESHNPHSKKPKARVDALGIPLGSNPGGGGGTQTGGVDQGSVLGLGESKPQEVTRFSLVTTLSLPPDTSSVPSTYTNPSSARTMGVTGALELDISAAVGEADSSQSPQPQTPMQTAPVGILKSPDRNNSSAPGGMTRTLSFGPDTFSSAVNDQTGLSRTNPLGRDSPAYVNTALFDTGRTAALSGTARSDTDSDSDAYTAAMTSNIELVLAQRIARALYILGQSATFSNRKLPARVVDHVRNERVKRATGELGTENTGTGAGAGTGTSGGRQGSASGNDLKRKSITSAPTSGAGTDTGKGDGGIGAGSSNTAGSRPGRMNKLMRTGSQESLGSTGIAGRDDGSAASGGSTGVIDYDQYKKGKPAPFDIHDASTTKEVRASYGATGGKGLVPTVTGTYYESLTLVSVCDMM